jgi:para-nitrobenzyl esterase
LYYFNHKPPRADNSPLKNAIGAIHAEELVYVFHHLDQENKPWTPADRVIADAMFTYWTNFAEHGSPNGDGVAEWPRFTNVTLATMHFDDKPTSGTVANAEKLKVLDSYFAWRRTPEGAAWVKQERP